MLSAALKNLSEEDSAGSDAESVQSLEPETDRFGFLVTSRSTAGNVGPAPELVRQREAKWIDIMGRWNHILLKKTSKVKVQCQKGIPASLRAKCWPLLCGATERMKTHEELYKLLDSQPALPSWVDVIERDLDRQFPFHEMFLSKDGHGQRGLFEVLKAYTQYKPNEGYCQAQGPVAAVLLMNMPTEEAFWCLVQICEQYLPGYYNPLLEGVLFDATLLMWVLKRTCPAAHKHLLHHGVEPLMFATDWLMCLFTRHLPFNMLLRVWDLFFCYGVRVLLQVAVVLVRRVLGRSEQRRQCQGQLETLERLRGVKEQVLEEDDAFIAEVCAVPLSAKDLEKKTEKELNKWRKDRPSSTFDPRSRCLGYRMAWATTLHNLEEQEKAKMERGNLSVPLSRSSSTLSLSFIPNNKRKKGGKGTAGERESSGKLVRHVSMGAKDDCRNWSDVRFTNKQDIKKEDVVLKEYIKQSESLTVHIKQRETRHGDDIKNQTVQRGQEAREGMEAMETKNTEKEIRQWKGPEEAVLFKPTGKIETLPTKDETLEDGLHSTEATTRDQQELDLETPSEPTELQTKDPTLEGTECSIEGEQRLDSDTPGGDPSHGQTEDQTFKDSSQPSEEANQCQQGLVYESRVREDQKHNGGDDEEEEVQDQSAATVKQMTRADAQTGVEDHDQSDTSRRQGTEAPHTPEQVVTELTNETTEEGCSNSNIDLEVPSVNDTPAKASPQGELEEKNFEGAMEGQDGTNEAPALRTCTEAEAPNRNATDAAELTRHKDTKSEDKVAQVVQDDGTAHRDKKDSKTGAEGFTDLTGKAEQAQIDEDQIQEDEEEPKAQQTDMTCSDVGTIDTIEPDGKGSLKDIKNKKELACDEVPTTVCSNERNLEITPEGRGVFTSSKSPATNAASHNVQSPLTDEQSELKNIQTPSRHNSKSSGDFCIRRSSTSRGSKMNRRLSEDLFTVPQKPTTQSLSTSCQQIEQDSPPTQGGDVAEEAETQKESSHPQKRFGLFRKIKAEQPKRNKTKRRQKMLVPKILIQDFSDGQTSLDTEENPDSEEKLSARERRRRRREQERRLKEEERLRKKREKELEKLMQQERRKVQARSKGLQAESEEKLSNDPTKQTQTGSQMNTDVTSYTESYF